jgi:class 3 adenylate cyclase/tetratricopeptide (TPR) repeat protein
MSLTPEQLEKAIAALEAQRGVLGDEVTDIALAPLRAQLAARQPARPQAPQQLKQVSILFVDTVGSTVLGQQLDPEQIHAVMDGALARYTEVVRAHHGRVLQYAGDSLLAAFGADQAQEDDPERAVQAGLAIGAEACRVADEVRRQHGIDTYAVRAGVHTGAVLLGGGVDEDGTIRGASVNIAARMEQSAPPGGLRISHDTWRHVRGRFELQEQPLLTVKGVATPLRNYLVLGPLDRQHRRNLRGLEGVATRLIGREAEWHQLIGHFDRVLQAGTAAQVTVVGDAGLGKSRLRAEFEQVLLARADPVWLLRAQSTPQRQAVPYGLLQDLVFERLAILDSDPAPVARRKLEQGLGQVLAERVDEHAALLGHLLGLDVADSPHVAGLGLDARQLRDRGLHALALYLQALHRSNGAPLVLLLDDLHWADGDSLRALSHLVRQAQALPLLLLGLTRASLYDSHPDWGTAGPQPLRLDLKPLQPQASTDLADALLARLGSVPPALRQLIVDQAEGNPFYMEELTAMLIDDGVIDTGSDPWQVAVGRLVGLRVPGTLKGVLQARLDGLPAADKQALQLASVIGHDFWDRPLQRLAPGAEQSLPQLEHHDLALPYRPSAFQDAQQYRFKHHLLHQVTYDSVLARIKRGAHAEVAAWLEAQGSSARPELIADHFERSGQTGPAAEYWQRAALAAEARYASAQALAHASRALELTAPDDLPRNWALRLLMEKSLNRQGEHAAQTECLAQIRQLAEQRDSDAWRCQWATMQANHLHGRGQSAAALQLANQALAWAPPDDLRLQTGAHEMAGVLLARLDRLDEAVQHLNQALAACHRASDLPAQARLLNQLGMVANDQGDIGRAGELFGQALAIHRQTGDRGNEAGTLSNQAYTWMALGEYPRAQARFAEALAISQAIGNRDNQALIHVNLALALLAQGRAADAPRAREHGHAALILLREVDDPWAEAAAWRVFGHAELALGQPGAAVQAFERSRTLFDSLQMGHLAVEAIAALALEAWQRGALPEALGHVEAILARQAGGASLGGTDEPLRIGLIGWQVLATAGDPRAAQVLQRTRAELQRRAACIADPHWRNSFLWQVPYHRLLLEAAGGDIPGDGPAPPTAGSG